MTTIVANKPEKTSRGASWILPLVLAVAGIGAAWYLQASQGLGVTGLGQKIVWGLYIAAFFTAAGAGVGLVILAALGEFNALPTSRHRNGILILSLACFVSAGILITMDLGNLANLMNLLTAARFSSMMTWDFWALAVTFVLTLVYLLSAWKHRESTPVTRTWGSLAALAGLALVVVESWMLSSLSARPFWGSALFVVQFLAAAAVAGLACAVLVWQDLAAKLAGWLKGALAVTLGLLLAEVLTDLVAADPRLAREIQLALANPFFWVQTVIGLLAPLALLVWGKGRSWFTAAAGLALVGVLSEKIWLLSTGQSLRWLDLPAGSYLPAWNEWLGVAGAVMLVAALYLGAKAITGLKEDNV